MLRKELERIEVRIKSAQGCLENAIFEGYICNLKSEIVENTKMKHNILNAIEVLNKDVL